MKILSLGLPLQKRTPGPLWEHLKLVETLVERTVNTIIFHKGPPSTLICLKIRSRGRWDIDAPNTVLKYPRFISHWFEDRLSKFPSDRPILANLFHPSIYYLHHTLSDLRHSRCEIEACGMYITITRLDHWNRSLIGWDLKYNSQFSLSSISLETSWNPVKLVPNESLYCQESNATENTLPRHRNHIGKFWLLIFSLLSRSLSLPLSFTLLLFTSLLLSSISPVTTSTISYI